MTETARRPTYHGIMRSGAHSMGQVPFGISPGEFVEKKYRAGWRFVEVHRGTEIAGRLERHRGERLECWGENE